MTSPDTTWIDRTTPGSPVKVYRSLNADPAIKVVIPVLATPQKGESDWVMKHLVDAGIPFKREALTGRILKSLERGKFTWTNCGDHFEAAWTP